MSIALTGHSDPFHLSSHLNGIYNARTSGEGGITATNTQAPITQVHEREISGLAVASGVTGEVSEINGVTEVTVPIYLAYDDVKSAVAAASGLKAGKGGLGEVAIAFERPGTVRCAWLGNRKRQYYHFDSTNASGTVAHPASLQQVYERMSDHMYSKAGDGLFSAIHSVPSVHYTQHDVKEVECTKIKIPRSVRPIVCSSPAPNKATNGSTVYPPGKFIVLFGFATMRCNSGESKDAVLSTPTYLGDGGWAFWLKTIVEVIVYAVEIAAALGQSYPTDSTPPAWASVSNLLDGAQGDTLPLLSQSRLNALRSLEKRAVKRLQTVSPSAKKKTKKN